MNRRLAANRDDAEALMHRGWLFDTEGKRSEAIPDLERLIQLRPDDADACWLLGQAYQDVGNLAGALAAFTRLLEVTPGDQVSTNVPGLLAPWSVRPYQQTNWSPLVPVNTKGDPLPNSPVMVPSGRKVAEWVSTSPMPKYSPR
jgi:tetratricopeptide (TPR) repeat protein